VQIVLAWALILDEFARTKVLSLELPFQTGCLFLVAAVYPNGP